MKNTIIRNVSVVNASGTRVADVLIKDHFIEKIEGQIRVDGQVREINGEGLHLFPGVIDDQVHFREPGLTHKGEIYTEARAAVAGGITSFMEMPNTVPNALTQDLLEDKYQRAAQVSLANYSFYMGASNSNAEEVLKTNAEKVCGVKIFMGSSTGDMLVDNTQTLERIFSSTPMLIATHCEDEHTVRTNMAAYAAQYGDDIRPEHHPLIRSVEACYLSSSKAVELAKKHGARLHILHISTAKELDLFEKGPVAGKKITAEACIHHLWFNDQDYATKGNYIKWNPAVKTEADRKAILQAVFDDRIDVIATDHAPHTTAEKEQPYLKAPSGGPLVQHSLQAMIDLASANQISLERMSYKMSQAVAELFAMPNRGMLTEGFFADAVLVDLNRPYTVSKENILYKCGWSPFEGHTFQSTILKTFVNGHLVFDDGRFDESIKGQRLAFKRS
ncbi:MAG TPA: dihydroorotase [Luteibaculaceae bacterium]|nr:dihydroorotase [Luteibaculaceae bacterium]